MRRLITILSSVTMILTSLFSNSAKAADAISHFYGASFFAAAAGIEINYALAMGVGNEMIDSGVWTSPMGLPTPRLLFHFMGTPVEFTVNEGGLKRGLAIATIKHPLFFNLLDVGMRTKDPVKLGAALHLLIDTFFHAGYSNYLGHGEGGHRPDMPYEEVQKARLCFQAIIEVIYLIRDMQGSSHNFDLMKRLVSEVMVNETYAKKLKTVTRANDLDGIIAVVSKRPDLFTQILLDNQNVRNAFFTNVEKSDQYWQIAMQEIFKIFKDKGYSKLKDSDFLDLTKGFSDVAARTDLDPMQSLKIMIYRILQMQDPVLESHMEGDLELGFDTENMKATLDKGHFNFAKLAGFRDIGAFHLDIENEVKKHTDSLGFLIANIENFEKQISKVDENGQITLLLADEWPQNTQTYAESIFPEILSWMRLFNKNGGFKLVEDRQIGNLVSTQTDTDWMKELLDHDPEYLKKTLRLFQTLENNPEQLELAARLRALAEMSYHLANNATKDLFPGKISPIKKVVYEDDTTQHAVFAMEARTVSVRNMIAKYLKINILKDPVDATTYGMRSIRTALAKIGIMQIEEQADQQVETVSQLTREFQRDIGFGVEDENGKIVMPIDGKDLIEVAPNLNLAGYTRWTSWTINYVWRIMFKFKKSKNAAIAAYIKNGEAMKSLVAEALYKMYYNGSDSQTNVLLDKYGELPTDVAGKHVIGLPGNSMKCEALFGHE